MFTVFGFHSILNRVTSLLRVWHNISRDLSTKSLKIKILVFRQLGDSVAEAVNKISLM